MFLEKRVRANLLSFDSCSTLDERVSYIYSRFNVFEEFYVHTIRRSIVYKCGWFEACDEIEEIFSIFCPWLGSGLGSQERQVFYLNGGGNAKMVYFVGFGGCFTFLWRK